MLADRHYHPALAGTPPEEGNCARAGTPPEEGNWNYLGRLCPTGSTTCIHAGELSLE